MSWLYVPEPVVDYSPPNTYLDSKQSVMSNTTCTASKSSRPEFKTNSLTMPPSGMTAAPSTGNPGVDLWILSLRASRANHSPKLERDLELMIPETSGLMLFALLERLGPSGSYWRIPQSCLPLFELLGEQQRQLTSLEYWQTWPRSGMWDATTAYQLQPLAPLTKGTVYGLWPTPVASDCLDRKPGNPHLTKNGTIRHINAQGKQSFMRLSQVVKFATLQARDYRTGSTARWEEARKGLRSCNLNDQIGGQLNPNWVEWLMGWPIGWTDLQPLETARFQQWLELHGMHSHDSNTVPHVNPNYEGSVQK